MKRYAVGICLILAISLFGVSAGMLYRSRGLSRLDGVTLEPTVIEPANDIFEGQQLTFNLVLHNRLERPVSVEEVVPSCGCMEVIARGGEPFQGPVTMPALSLMPLALTVSSESRIGAAEYNLLVRASDGRQQFLPISRIKLNVLARWRAEPSQLVFHEMERGATIEREIGIYDSYPDPGISIDRVSPSNPSRVKVATTPCDNASGRAPENLQFGKTVLTKRYGLKVQFAAPDRLGIIQEQITIHAKDGSIPELRIPITCSAKPSAYTLCPAALVFASPTSGAKYTRKVTCIVQRPHDVNLKVLTCPEHVSVTIGAAESSGIEITVVLSIPPGQDHLRLGDRTKIVFGAGKTHTPVAELPIVLLSTAHTAGTQ